jgi:hypothetical protein
MSTYEELQIELKNTIQEIKQAQKNSIEYIKLKRKVFALHAELYKIEKMINNFK